MSEFYTFPWIGHIFIILIFGISTLIETLLISLEFIYNWKDRRHAFKLFFEIFILLEIIIFSLLYGQMLSGYKNGFLLASGYLNTRIIIFLFTLVLGLISYINNKDRDIFLPILAASISLPIVEEISKSIYPLLFIGALLLLLIRSIKNVINRYIEIRTNITALSIPYGLDTLPTGVLFSEAEGHILLINHKMYDLMLQLTGKIYRNLKTFYKILDSKENESKYKKAELGGQTVYLLADGSAWIFIKTNIFLKTKEYIHISASDVTQLWLLTSKLELQKEELKDKGDKLKKAISNLDILSKKEEIHKAKMRTHDILGQRLTVLLRIIQNEDKLDHDLLKSLSKGLLAELSVENNQALPYEELKRMQEVFSAIGVKIDFKGSLPDKIQQASLFLDIIREACTNAVRHALATEINIKAELKENKHQLTISNNGYPPTTPITLGNGIKEMKKSISDQGGNLNIIEGPIFTLSVVLPGGNSYE